MLKALITCILKAHVSDVSVGHHLVVSGVVPPQVVVKFFFFFAARRDAFYHRVLQEHHLPECMCALELLVHEALSY